MLRNIFRVKLTLRLKGFNFKLGMMYILKNIYLCISLEIHLRTLEPYINTIGTFFTA